MDGDRRVAMRAGIIGRPAILVAVLIGLAAGLGRLWTRVEGWRLDALPAVYGSLEDIHTTTALVVRDETLLAAPAGGRVTLLVEEGTRVRTQAVIASVETTRGERLVRAPRPGTVFWHWDGWERFATSAAVFERSPDQWREARFEGGRMQDGQEIESGRPLARLVNSHAVYLYVSLRERDVLEPEQTIAVRLPAVSGDELRARVVAVRNRPQAALLELDRYVPVLDSARWVEAELVLARYKGVAIPLAAVVWVDGEPGVFLRQETGVTFRAVRLGPKVNERVIVEGIAPGETVVGNPSRVRRP
ncbi:MAG: DUF2118 domain-containing protein [Firmicutes bacterium]|nr:DUF2118 domain-containing protein [Bacillota bacterium]